MNKPRKKRELIEYSEESFIENFKDQRLFTKIYLLSGLKMNGYILGSDEYTVLISSKEFGSQMIYKHAIATLSAIPDMDMNNSHSECR